MNQQQARTLSMLAGVWRLEKSEFTGADGEVMYPLGEDAVGQAIFTESGYMSAQLMRPHRRRFASESQALGTPEEAMEAFIGYIAYYGHCAVDVDQQTITTVVAGSMYPNWVGGEQLRHYQLSGDRLVLRTPPMAIGDEEFTGVLTWQRV